MSQPALEILILAAGAGTRMRSALPKVLQPLAGRTLLDHVLASARALQPARLHLLVGHGADQVRAAVAGSDLNLIEQTQRLGTGHAVQQALPHLRPGNLLLVLYGDVPLIQPATLAALVAAAQQGLAILTTHLAEPFGFGRILRDAQGQVQAIVEEKDASAAQRGIQEVNSGVLALPVTQAQELLPKLSNQNAQSEYLLTDLVALTRAAGLPVLAREAAPLEVAGVNDKAQLAALERTWQQTQAQALLAQGVTLADPARLDVRGELTCGQDCFLDINVVLEGRVVLGNRVRVGAGAIIRDAEIGDDVEIKPYSLIDGAQIGSQASIGPFARLRPGTELAAQVHIGNFVETKKASLGIGSKANHLAYIGDATLGAGCNVGAGSITCNYDGVNKHQTLIGDRVFVGSNSTLVAPLQIANDAFIAAGSTVTVTVRQGDLAVGRARQRNIPGWKTPAHRQDDSAG